MVKALNRASTLIQSSDVAVRQLDDQTLLLPVRSNTKIADNEFFALDMCGNEVWSRVDGKRTVANILTELDQAFSAPAEDVTELLSELVEYGLIQIVGEEAA